MSVAALVELQAVLAQLSPVNPSQALLAFMDRCSFLAHLLQL